MTNSAFLAAIIYLKWFGATRSLWGESTLMCNPGGGGHYMARVVDVTTGNIFFVLAEISYNHVSTNTGGSSVAFLKELGRVSMSRSMFQAGRAYPSDS